jgi:ribosomal protein S12 methylthiotransferase
LLYVYSAGLTERVVELLAGEPRIVPYLDLPIQHASDRMLQRMRRPECQESIRRKVRWLREALPEVTLRTTAIVGFPGETEEDFRTLCRFAEEIQFERLGVFTYSAQEGTRAADYDDDVPNEIKRDRQDELLEMQRSISEERLARYVGCETNVLVDAITDPDADGATHLGRVPWQADDVDGITHLRQGGWARPGSFVRARIEGNEDYDFHAIALERAPT